jgi:outer membrane receptor protein involved in Fe transport
MAGARRIILRQGFTPLLLLAQLACAPRTGTTIVDRASGTGGVVVVTGRQLIARGGNLLDALRGRVSNMRVDRVQGRCPLIALRGEKTFIGTTNPNIYIDGTRMGDTCALDQVQLPSVERVEVYRGGISPPAGITPAANGVILVFLTSR